MTDPKELDSLLRKLRLDLEAFGATVNAMRREVNRYRKALKGAREGAPGSTPPYPLGPNDHPKVPET